MLRQIDDTPSRAGLQPAMKHEFLLAQIRRLKGEKDRYKADAEEAVKTIEEQQREINRLKGVIKSMKTKRNK
jgi:multidrug resistance efflux pump